MAKHTAPPRRRHSAQKHTSHKGVTLYTLGVLLVAVSALLFLRFWPRRSVDAVPPAAEVESPAVSEELAVPEPTGSIRRRSAAKSLRPLPIPASRPPASAPKRFTG